MKHCKKFVAIASALLVLGFTACSSDGDGGSGSDDSIQTGIPATGKPAGTTPKTPASTATTTTGPTGTTGATGITTNGTPTTNRTPSANGLVKPTYKTVYNVTADTYMAKIDEIIARLNANNPSQPKEFEFKFSGTKPITYDKFYTDNTGDSANGFREKIRVLYSRHQDVRIGLDFTFANVEDAFITGQWMFEDGQNYKSIVLPRTKTDDLKLGGGVFKNCNNLEYIKLPDNLGGFSYDGYNFTSDGSVELKIEIPSTVKEITAETFYKSKNLTTVIFNEGLETIGNNAFASDSNLKTVKIPSTLKAIGNYAFRECTALTNINLNSGLEKISENAFLECTSLETIELPSSLLSIGNYAFTHTKLKNVIIPESVGTMGTGIFWNCHELETVEIYAPIIGTDVLAEADVKSLIIGEKVKEIGTGNFVSTLTSVVFKNPEGWKCDGVPVDSAILKDPAAAATYLKTKKDKVFTRQ
ncbi:MAG: leucine-rich repeat protein [Treponema sp.]|uniref:leucine-rich repeat protein n=1 Tax=Treponema sp. TaxID=166 RepID=UPI002A9113BF|nr:leucine-rich repeat protein [Treponema sp.]MDY6397477.1 leucine-rich repeat protein [Treponema sp.]